jgi:hypothetical protein
VAKFCGIIGYAAMAETAPGVWREVIDERQYFGEVIRNTRKTQPGEYLNDDVTIDNQLSIVADPFAYAHFSQMRYVKWMGALWKITSIEVQRPRLILTVGGVYNDQQTLGTSETP